MAQVIVSNPVDNKVDSKLIVEGVIVRNTKPGKEKYGSIMFESKTLTLGTGFANVQKRVAFLNGEIATLQQVVKNFNLKAGSPLEGFKIVVTESLTPSYEGHQPKINPTTAEIMTKNGLPIYRDTRLVEEGSAIVDTLIQHDNAATKSTADLNAAIMSSLGVK